MSGRDGRFAPPLRWRRRLWCFGGGSDTAPARASAFLGGSSGASWAGVLRPGGGASSSAARPYLLILARAGRDLGVKASSASGRIRRQRLLFSEGPVCRNSGVMLQGCVCKAQCPELEGGTQDRKGTVGQSSGKATIKNAGQVFNR